MLFSRYLFISYSYIYIIGNLFLLVTENYIIFFVKGGGGGFKGNAKWYIMYIFVSLLIVGVETPKL